MKVQGNDRIIDKLLGKDGELFNLVAFIREQPFAAIYTDGNSFLTAQTSPFAPMWIWTDGNPGSGLYEVLSEAVNNNVKLRINARDLAENTLLSFAKENGLELVKGAMLKAYSGGSLKKVQKKGSMIEARPEHESLIKELIKIASLDAGGVVMTDEEAADFAKKHSRSGNLFLWQDKEIVSMARIIKYGVYGRISAVVTVRTARGRGYAKMLVGGLAERLISEGLVPVLYAHADNLSSNACYSHLGFEMKGGICEYTIKQKEQ